MENDFKRPMKYTYVHKCKHCGKMITKLETDYPIDDKIRRGYDKMMDGLKKYCTKCKRQKL